MNHNNLELTERKMCWQEKLLAGIFVCSMFITLNFPISFFLTGCGVCIILIVEKLK
jgi:hypothetical protein